MLGETVGVDSCAAAHARVTGGAAGQAATLTAHPVRMVAVSAVATALGLTFVLHRKGSLWDGICAP